MALEVHTQLTVNNGKHIIYFNEFRFQVPFDFDQDR